MVRLRPRLRRRRGHRWSDLVDGMSARQEKVREALDRCVPATSGLLAPALAEVEEWEQAVATVIASHDNPHVMCDPGVDPLYSLSAESDLEHRSERRAYWRDRAEA